MTILSMVAGLAALVFINVPIAVALGLVALGAMILTQGTAVLPIVAIVMSNGARRCPLLARPLFTFAGAIMNSTFITRRRMDFALAVGGFIRGGLADVNVVQSLFFAEIS